METLIDRIEELEPLLAMALSRGGAQAPMRLPAGAGFLERIPSLARESHRIPGSSPELEWVDWRTEWIMTFGNEHIKKISFGKS